MYTDIYIYIYFFFLFFSFVYFEWFLTFIVSSCLCWKPAFHNVDDRLACLSTVDLDTWGLGDYKN